MIGSENCVVVGAILIVDNDAFVIVDFVVCDDDVESASARPLGESKHRIAIRHDSRHHRSAPLFSLIVVIVVAGFVNLKLGSNDDVARMPTMVAETFLLIYECDFVSVAHCFL